MKSRTQNHADTIRDGAGRAFGLALVIAAAFFVPVIIYDNGYFMFLGDFNVIRSRFITCARGGPKREVWLNWKTTTASPDRVVQFLQLFSPFFCLTQPFDTDFVIRT